MNFILSKGFEEIIDGVRIYLDTDFLNEIYQDKELFSYFSSLALDRAALIVDPLTKFEFMRSIFVDVKNREDFLEQEVFTVAVNHQEKFLKIQENALTLSKIYAHNSMGLHSSPIDLFLAGRIMLEPNNITKIITANLRDFPQCVFETEGIISKIQRDNNVESFCLLSLNSKKFEDATKKLEKVN